MKDSQDKKATAEVLDLARGKKRRNNRLEELLIELVAAAEIAKNASRCQESMLADCRSAGVKVPDELYLLAMGHCDEVQPFVDDCLGALGQYRQQVDGIRRRLELSEPG